MRRLWIAAAGHVGSLFLWERAQAEPLTLDPARTDVSFAIGILGVATSHGRFPEVSGCLTRSPHAPQDSAVDVDVRLATVEAGSPQADRVILGPRLFDAARYPTVHFISRRITPVGDGAAEVDGDLTMHGVTRSLHLLAPITEPDGPQVAFLATAHLRRSDYGMTSFRPMVGDDVVLTIRAVFNAAP